MSSGFTCQYKDCNKEATTKGTVFTMNPDGGKDIPITVYACDTHNQLSGFFEDKEERP